MALAAAALAIEPRYTSAEETITVTEILKPGDIGHEQGFAYVCPLRNGRPGDRESRSNCALLEDGKPLPAPRALHADIRTQGQGRYSHWTADSLYFSASDNSDPRTNGRAYSLVSRQRVLRRWATVTLDAAQCSYAIEAGKNPPRNTRLTVRNTSDHAVIYKLGVNGQPDLTSVPAMLQSILKPGMTDEQKAIAIWKLLVDWRYHYYPAEGGDEIHDPVKFLNVYGYGFCDDAAHNFARLCRETGIRARAYGLNGHVVGEAFFDGRWHMLDPDHEVFYRMPQGHIASVEELAAHPELITKTPRDPIGSDTATIARMYTTTNDNRPDEKNYPPLARLEPQLMPGDQVVYELSGQRAHSVEFSKEPLPPTIGNGTLNRSIYFRGKSTNAEYWLEWPYVILGAQVNLTLAPAADPPALFVVNHSRFPTPATWTRDGRSARASLDFFFDREKSAYYRCMVRFEAARDQRLADVIADGRATIQFQFAPRAAPRVGPGRTAFEATIASVGATALPASWKGLEVTHQWDEEAAAR